MNPENDHIPDDHWDDERLTALFAAADSDGVPPDRQLLERLRERSTEVFAAAGSQQTQLSPRRRNVFALAIRTAAASAAAVTIVGACLWSLFAPGAAAGALGKALDKVSAAQTVELKVTQADQTGQIWANNPKGQMRWNLADGTYRIARGAHTWLVDEKANRAASQPAVYFREGQPGLDVLSLVGLPEEADRKALLGQAPVEQVDRGGAKCDVYRTEVAWAAGKVEIEALVDSGTQMFRSICKRIPNEPVVTVELVAVNKPVDDSLFLVAETLTEDGRVGKVVDVQGTVAVKPVMHRRWTPLVTHMLLNPGDWVRTDLRGANAVAMRLVRDTNVTLGPGTLVEVVWPNKLRLTSGALKIAADPKSPVALLGPKDQKVEIKGTEIYQLEGEKLARVEKPPLWLQGFEGATNNESIGSLVANVDGRNVPLAVGYHKVTVDIRDQIARTVIEESFVNHTGARLEGIFYFPLPQDASISGFGMWIGTELVEADVVEKQRAREIYEIILRERRDPGLLEWTGGNIFKARVFPIEASSEKRLKITYTQVLPLQGKSYRYSYGLQSELLKQNPLRKLGIDVKVSSVMPLTDVSSPTHTARIDKTDHAAHVEFTAQEYTPDRDFEVVVTLGGAQSDVVLIPHRRGADGYFMLMLTPPSGEGQWQREVLADGQPLELLVLADTSASIDAEGRRAQAEFLAALLGALTAEDKINVASCDVDCDWVFPGPVPADEKNVQTARDVLAARVSLGWTDLDKAFESALKQCGPKTHIIYLGDGIVTAKDADPVAFTKRLKLLFEGKTTACHAVSLSSSFEPVVMKTIASLGGGSVRPISGEKGPQAVAMELLGEISKPTIRDLKVEFKGLRTARVYPEELPNLVAGTQQILLGRYSPDGHPDGGAQGSEGDSPISAAPKSGQLPAPGQSPEQEGEVIVTGVEGDQPVKFTAKVSLKDAEQGNSFIPRLWARMHLDALLQQGTAQAVRDEIIALSEEYNIITPYTSLLVLESDADRERFGVKRRYQMRDAQKFFAQGRDQVDYQLIQQQMKRAGDWRLGLRRGVLRQLLGLGRDGRIFQALESREPTTQWGFWSSGTQGLQRRSSGRMVSYNYYDMTGGIGGLSQSDASSMTGPIGGISDMHGLDFGFNGRAGITDEFLSRGIEAKGGGSMRRFDEDLPLDGAEGPLPDDELAMDVAVRLGFDLGPATSAAQPVSSELPESLDGDHDVASRPERRLSALPSDSVMELGQLYYVGKPVRPVPSVQQYRRWLGTLFPHLPPPPPKETDPKTEKPWPAEAVDLAKTLLRTEQIAKLEGGLRIERQVKGFHARWSNLGSCSETLDLVSPRAWLVRSGGHGSQIALQWCDGKQRGVLSRAFQLGRIRTSTERDLTVPPLGLLGWATSRLDREYSTHAVELKPQSDDRVLLILTHPNNTGYEARLLIDTKRHVVLSVEYRQDGKVTSTTRFDEYVELAGAWWAGRMETTDAEGRLTSQTVQKLALASAEDYQRQIDAQLAGRDQVQFLTEPLVNLVDAKRVMAAGKANFDDLLALILRNCDIQQWDRVLELLDQAVKAGGNKPGMEWVRDALLSHARRREELRQRILERAATLAKTPPADKADSQDLFLADHVLGQAAGILEANEMLALLDTLKPIYDRQPEHVLAARRWTQQQINYLQQTGQADESLRLQEELANAYPHDGNVQQQYAQALFDRGDTDAAYAWLDRVITPEAKWLPNEEDTLRNAYAQLLRQQGRYPDLVEYLRKWVEKNPESGSLYGQYLSAMVRADQLEKVNALVAAWMQEGRKPEKLPMAAFHRLQAAVSLALGQGYDMYTNRLEEQWLDDLAQTALFAARDTNRYPYLANIAAQIVQHKQFQANIADQIMQHGQFQRTDACRKVRRQVLGILTAEVDTLAPEVIQRLVNWLMPNDPAVEKDVWQAVATRLEKRWADEKDIDAKHALGQALTQVLSGRVGAEQYLAFLRRQLREGPEKHRTLYVRSLFDALLGQPHSAEYETEAFGLLEQLSDAEEPAERLLAEVQALYRLTDRMVQTRYDVAMAKVEHQEKLTRIELRTKKTENLRAAREGCADRLAEEIRKRQPPLATWMNIERIYLDTLLDRNLDRVAEECWEILGPEPPKPIAADAPPDLPQQLDRILRHRAMITLANLAARKGAKPELIDRLLKYVDAAIAAADPQDVVWKLLKQQLLIALDRPAELQKDLEQWVRVDDPDNRWRLALGYLLAEQGKFAPAITLLEAVEAADELGPQEYRTLADWYLVADQAEKREAALISVFEFTEEWRLNNWLYQKLRPWQRREGELPSELYQEVLRALAALFQKSASPQNYLSRLREFYQATHDFRLLTSLADAVVGNTAGKVYPFLQGMSEVLGEIRDEATADSILERIGKVRARAKTTVDQRALDLLEALVERRSAEVLNQPGPHTDKAVAALQRAFQREWSAGEPRLMADLLASLGKIAEPRLAEEQLRELETLHGQAEKGSTDWMHIGHRWANAQWIHGRHDQAIDLLALVLDTYQAACKGVLPNHANGALDNYVSYLEQRTHHARGEQVLMEQLKHPANQQQTYWLRQRLYQLYESAIGQDGKVSLGRGPELYRAVERKLQEELDTPDRGHRHQLIDRLCSIYRTAHNKKIEGVVEDLRAFAFRRLPQLMEGKNRPIDASQPAAQNVQTAAAGDEYQPIVRSVADLLHEIAGARDALAFLVERIQAEPKWFRLNNQDGWSQFSYLLAQWRVEVKQLGDVEAPLLKLVLDELRRDLRTQQERNRIMYNCEESHYWKEKEADFAKAAEEVYAERKTSGSTVTYIADYIYRRLHHYDRAIEMLWVAQGEKRLDEDGQTTLVRFLHDRNRFGESIAILQPLVELRPDIMKYRTQLMHAYFQTKRPDELLGLLKQTDEYFHKENRWDEGAMAALGQSCLENALFEQSAAYYEEAVSLRKRNAANRGSGDGTLSGYCNNMAQAYAGLKNTAKAVDAACEAIVSWGARIENRTNALESLKQVLRAATDLDGYAAGLDKQPQESPIVRKAIGMVYAEKRQFDKAIAQLTLARQAEPNDSETHTQLIACYDQKGDKEGALQQALASLQLSRRDIQLYKRLAERYNALERAKDTERAYTSIVEMLPTESESHTLLAEIRQQQNRWDEAMEHWQQVARIRALEPTALLKLAEAQIHQKQWDAAAETLRKLDTQNWPPRFGDVHGQVRNLERQIEQGRKP